MNLMAYDVASCRTKLTTSSSQNKEREKEENDTLENEELRWTKQRFHNGLMNRVNCGLENEITYDLFNFMIHSWNIHSDANNYEMGQGLEKQWVSINHFSLFFTLQLFSIRSKIYCTKLYHSSVRVPIGYEFIIAFYCHFFAIVQLSIFLHKAKRICVSRLGLTTLTLI